MNTENKKSNSPSKSKWIENAQGRVKNRKWLNYSNKIAMRVLACIEDNPNMNQAKLAELLGVFPQQVSKIVKGKENLTLETIGKLSDMLGFELITFPEFKYSIKVQTTNVPALLISSKIPNRKQAKVIRPEKIMVHTRPVKKKIKKQAGNIV